MKIFIEYLMILTIGIYCCQRNVEDQRKIKTFNLTELPDVSDVKLSDLNFTDIEYIPLETNGQNAIGHFDIRSVTHRFIADDSFFIIKLFNDILKFQSNGSFVSRIGNAGRGPDEFEVAHDVDINEKSSLYLVSGFQEKFNVYDENGNFDKTFKISNRGPVQFRLSEDKILCYLENLQGDVVNSFFALDTLGRILKTFPNKYPFKPFEGRPTGIGRENLFYSFDNQLYKKEVYSDTVYVFENLFFKPHIVLEVGNRLLTPDARSKFDLSYLGENFVRQVHLFEFGDYIYYEYYFNFKLGTNNKLYGFIGSKTTDFQTFIDADKGLINDLDGGPDIIPKSIKDNNTLICWVDAIKLKNHVASDAFKNSKPKYPEKKKELEILANKLKETDNPVLMIVKFAN